MEQLTYRFSLDTHKNGSQRTLQGFETGDTISRQLIISLTENEESYELPLDNVVAVMYVLRPSQSSPSINTCTIDGNQIIYDITADDLQEEGIVQMQLKVVSGTIANPHRVLVSPRFNIEVWESFAADSEAEDTQEYTALEDALIRAKMCYDGRIADFNIDADGTLTVVYGIVDDYNEDEAYAVNDKCYYGGKAWKCLQACTGETPEEGSYWTEISIDEAHITYTSDYLKNAIIAVSPTITVGTVTTGSPTSVTNSGTTTNAVFDFVLEKGEKGDDGADGQDGVSPVANVTKSGDTATITITDAIGTTTATISDGTDGTNGQDGFSPVANVSKTGNTATITITDAIGTTTAQISDGAGGDTVSWNQITSSGTKIATVTINNTPTDVYAPTSGGGGGATSLAGLDDVTISSASNGQALVYDSSATKWKNTSLSIPADIDDLTDVTISSASDGQVLTYDNANSVWKNASLPSTDLDDLTDVTISSASDGQVLTYDNANSVWKNASLPSTGIDDLSDVTITSATSGDFLKYDGSKWINGAGGSASAINDLTDVTITSATNGQVLTYDSANSIWKNANATGGGLLPHIIVITEEGSTVTATKTGETTVTFTETSTGHYEGDVTAYGTWTIHSVLGVDDATTSLVVDDCKIYTIDDSHFSASITVYYPQGGTCSCSMTGEQTLYANTCPYTFTVHKAGTWTISTTEYGETFTETVVITTDGQTETVSLPDGSVITPTDDVPALLACAGIGDSQDATLADLLADSTTLLAVLTTDNAIDYLVRSTTFASDITADEDAMAMMGSYDYASDTLLADSTWATAIIGSTYASSVINISTPKMTSDNTPSGVCSAKTTYSGYPAWKAFDKDDSTLWASATNPSDDYLRYKFAKAVSIGFVKIKTLYSGSLRLKTLSIKASNDNFSTSETLMATITLTNQNVEDYLYPVSPSTKFDSYGIENLTTYQSDVEIKELDFLGRLNGGVQSWLKAGGITDKTYTTLAEVLADTTTLSALIASQDAVDYLVTAKGLIDGIVADATAMSYIGLNNYCANSLIADSDWLDAIANSTYIDSVLNIKAPIMTDATHPSGTVYGSAHYGSYAPYQAFASSGQYTPSTTPASVAYKFTKEVKIYCVKFEAYRLVASNGWTYSIGTNNADYTNVYTGNGNADTGQTFYSYSTLVTNPTAKDTHRLTVNSNNGLMGVRHLQFYGREDV